MDEDTLFTATALVCGPPPPERPEQLEYQLSLIEFWRSFGVKCVVSFDRDVQLELLLSYYTWHYTNKARRG